MKKHKLHIDEQVTKMIDKGIHFNLTNIPQAKYALANNTYLYKIFYYRKNFRKTPDGKYGIEFAYLSDLASIDMKIRYTLIHMCLDIEHSLKTIINKYISEDNTEDGYEIIKNFIRDTDISKDKIFSSKMNWRTRKIAPGFQKHYNNPPYWVCLEIMSYGIFVEFVEYYYSVNPYKKLKFARNHLKFAKNVRNKSAHNSVFIVPLDRSELLPDGLFNFLSSKGVKVTGGQSLPLIDIAAVITLHEKYCSDGIKSYRKDALEDMKKRYERNLNYYDKHDNIKLFFKNLSKIIDKYNT